MTISTGAMSWLVFIIFGGIAGWIASIICKRNGSMGIIANIVVGIIGSVIGRFVMEEFFNKPGVTGFNLWSFLVAVGGASILLFLINLIRRKR